MSQVTPSFAECRISPKGRGIERLQMLALDLKTMCQDLAHSGSVSCGLAEAVERNMLALLDDISPEIGDARAKYERYAAAPKIGGDR
jgi:hypothetical protein